MSTAIGIPNYSRDFEFSLNDPQRLRSLLAELFDIPYTQEIIFSPGSLVGLSFLLSGLSVERIALTSDEYFSPHHFPGFTVEAFAVDEFLESLTEFRPDAVVLSLVNWHGLQLPVSKLISDIKASPEASSPIIIVDYSHAGAIGFPSISGLSADIVLGDCYKWVTNPEYYGNLSFISVSNTKLWEKLQKIFHPFYLAVGAETDNCFKSRWINPRELSHLVAWLRESHLTRQDLKSQHERNLLLKQTIVTDCNLVNQNETAIIWADEDVLPSGLLRRFSDRHLAWRPSSLQKVRLLCRSNYISYEPSRFTAAG